MGRKCTLLLKEGTLTFFRRKTNKLFCDIDALAVSMSQKFLRSFFLKSAFSFLSRCIFLPRKLLHPVIAVGFDGGGDALEELIGIQTEDN